MKLNSLKLRNFRAAVNVQVQAKGKNLSIYAENRVGKTTIADGYCWLIFGKDSQGKADFDIKTTKNGEVLHNLEHSVEGIFEIDGRELTLEKIFKEKWETQRGAANKTFTGHTTSHFVNGVPVNETEYKRTISGICSEDRFQLLSVPGHFSEKLHWTKAREMLLEVCGDVSIEDIVASNSKLKALPVVLNGRTVDDYKKIVKARQDKINEELKQIPNRIDEVSRGLPAEEEGEVPVIEALRTKLSDLQTKKAQAGSGGAVAEKEVELSRIKSALQDLETKLKSEVSKGRDEVDFECRRKQTESSGAFSQVQAAKSNIEQAKRKIATCANERTRLREEFAAEKAKNFTYEGETSCAACGQDLPKDKVLAARSKAEEEFNAKKAERIGKIQSEGTGYKAEQETLEGELTSLEQKLADLSKYEETLNGELSDLKAKLDRFTAGTIDLSKSPEYVAKLDETKKVIEAITALRQDSSTAASSYDESIAAAQAEIQKAEGRSARIAERAKGLARIQELEKSQVDYSAEFQKNQSELFLIEEFIRAKVKMLTEKINSRFELVSFKLFDEQVNGGISECCEATIDGRPYATSLSNSEKINAGLDIIKTLSLHYGFTPPIFVDNCEANTAPLETPGQQIRLFVSKPDKTLRFELEETKTPELQEALI